MLSKNEENDVLQKVLMAGKNCPTG